MGVVILMSLQAEGYLWHCPVFYLILGQDIGLLALPPSKVNQMVGASGCAILDRLISILSLGLIFIAIEQITLMPTFLEFSPLRDLNNGIVHVGKFGFKIFHCR